MRRRFGRGRRDQSSNQGRATGIDAERIFARMVEEKIVAAESLTPVHAEGVPESLAALGTGQSAEGRALIVGFAPRHGGDAALAAIAHALATPGFAGEVVAVAPQWTGAARRRLGMIGALPFPFRALSASGLDDGESRVQAETAGERVALPPRPVLTGISAQDRELFARAVSAFSGLAAKHGGAVRGVPGGVELILQARRVAVLKVGSGGITLEALLPERSSARLRSDELSTAMDRLEGQLRKRLGDRRIRTSEEGLRSEILGALTTAGGVAVGLRWPLSGSDPEVIDLVGVREDGRTVVAAARLQLGLSGLGAILDAVATLEPSLPLLLGDLDPPGGPGRPELLLAAKEIDAPVVALLPAIGLETRVFDIESRRGREPVLIVREAAPAIAPEGTPVAEREVSRDQVRDRDQGRDRDPGRDREQARDRGRSHDRNRDQDRDRGRDGGRDRDRSQASDRSSRDARPDDRAAPEARDSERDGDRGARDGGRSTGARFEEVSLFDLDDDASSESSGGDGEDSSSRRRRRGRGRRRGRRSSGGSSESSRDEAQPAPGGRRDAPEPKAERPRAAVDVDPETDDDDLLADEDDLDLSGVLAPIDEEEEAPARAPSYDDDEGDDDGDDDASADLEEKKAAERRSAPAPVVKEAVEKPKPRRRCAIVAHADRNSIMAAILLARDLRLVEGFWIYPQDDLMTFFRGVATDLREDTPIWVVGFRAHPARDTLQAASLYAGRIGWFDHHDWPPEDLDALRRAIGEDNVVVHPGAGSSLPGVLSMRTRRSRFSDKLVELVNGCFSLHDYERWGRVWWHRLGDLATKHGDQRAAVDKLLSGRPSDLTKEAESIAPPPPPAEVAYVAGRDFRLVHFGGYVMAVVPTPPELDMHLAGRIARERYSADLSLTYREGEELIVLAGEEGRGYRGLDPSRMADHLATKHEWIESLPDDDRIARIRVRDLAVGSERLDEVIREIAMGRSALEG